MKIQSVFDAAFAPYGKVIRGLDTAELERAMEQTPCPDGATVYVPGDEKLEALPIMKLLSEQVYGGMPIQIGYCNGDNHVMNCLEYHRDSEVNLACTDLILLLGKEGDIDFENYAYDTARVEAFLAPKGTLIEVYATTLHYAPINAAASSAAWWCCPRARTPIWSSSQTRAGESRLLTATNKWLLAHGRRARGEERRGGGPEGRKPHDLTGAEREGAPRGNSRRSPSISAPTAASPPARPTGGRIPTRGGRV